MSYAAGRLARTSIASVAWNFLRIIRPIRRRAVGSLCVPGEGDDGELCLVMKLDAAADVVCGRGI